MSYPSIRFRSKGGYAALRGQVHCVTLPNRVLSDPCWMLASAGAGGGGRVGAGASASASRKGQRVRRRTRAKAMMALVEAVAAGAPLAQTPPRPHPKDAGSRKTILPISKRSSLPAVRLPPPCPAAFFRRVAVAVPQHYMLSPSCCAARRGTWKQKKIMLFQVIPAIARQPGIFSDMF